MISLVVSYWISVVSIVNWSVVSQRPSFLPHIHTVSYHYRSMCLHSLSLALWFVCLYCWYDIDDDWYYNSLRRFHRLSFTFQCHWSSLVVLRPNFFICFWFRCFVTNQMHSVEVFDAMWYSIDCALSDDNADDDDGMAVMTFAVVVLWSFACCILSHSLFPIDRPTDSDSHQSV